MFGNMRAAFTLNNEKYSNVVPLGCLSHLLHLLCTDILQSKSIQNFLTYSIEIEKRLNSATFYKQHLLEFKTGRFKKKKYCHFT